MHRECLRETWYRALLKLVFFFFFNINRNLLRDSFKMCYKLYTGISLPLSLSRTDFLVLKNRGENKHTLFYLNILWGSEWEKWIQILPWDWNLMVYNKIKQDRPPNFLQKLFKGFISTNFYLTLSIYPHKKQIHYVRKQLCKIENCWTREWPY